ncbi:hypothetical protein DFH11DRAFT_1880269 [Phellopilus nigrolimitatus]|nr:hypothetical protein DFH11DRAFT_1880269 [Phellopilus nigrolimitatus]
MSTASPTAAVSGLSALFSLSNAAASVPPMPVSVTESGKVSRDSKDLAAGKNGSHVLKHRRLSSAGQTRRRASDARDAVSRPNPASLSAASALASLSSLSLSSSGIHASVSPAHTAMHSHAHHTRARSQTNIGKQNDGSGRTPNFVSVSYETNPAFNGYMPIAISGRRSGLGSTASSVPTQSYMQDIAASAGDDIEVDVEEDFDDGVSVIESIGGGEKRGSEKKGAKGGKVKKRGTIFKCESCSKVYRHPSCLVKHRWEHSPHWREASKFLLSKHQQVQLLEAATILSHLDPGTSLPEDRSLWPSYLSDGLLPPPSTANASSTNPLVTTISARPNSKISPSLATHPVSSSLPGPRIKRDRSGSASMSPASNVGTGPRMHDYAVQGGITQIRPGLLAHPTAPAAVLSSTTISPYAGETGATDSKDAMATLASMAVTSPFKPQPMAVPSVHSPFVGYRDASGSVPSGSGVSLESGSLAHSGGWSLPRSDLRSSSVARSYSASHSGSRSDDEDDAPEGSDEEVDVNVDVDVADGESRTRARFNSVVYESESESYDAGSPKYGFASRGAVKERDHAIVKKEVDDEWSMAMDMDQNGSYA